MTNHELEQKIFASAQRREIHADLEAKLHGISIPEARKIINKLVRTGMLYQSTSPKRSYWGSTFACYRAN